MSLTCILKRPPRIRRQQTTQFFKDHVNWYLYRDFWRLHSATSNAVS